jgi:hypothetical protein
VIAASPKAPYTIVGVSLNKREMKTLQYESARLGVNRSEVFKQALKYWMGLDSNTRDRAIIETQGGEVLSCNK